MRFLAKEVHRKLSEVITASAERPMIEKQFEKFSRSLTNWEWVSPALILGLIVCLYASVLIELVTVCWNDPQLSQGLLIPPVGLYLVWLRKASWLERPSIRDNRGLFLIAVACIMYVGGMLAAEVFLPRMSFVVLIGGLIWAFHGVGRLRSVTLPLLLLATMVPIPILVYNTLSVPLKLMASSMATSAVRELGVAVYRDGNIIHLARISLGIEEACNGLASASSLFIFSLLLGSFACRQRRCRILLTILSIPLAVAVNIARIMGAAIMAGHHPEMALGFYHAFSGWLVFLTGLAALCAIAAALNATIAR